MYSNGVPCISAVLPLAEFSESRGGTMKEDRYTYSSRKNHSRSVGVPRETIVGGKAGLDQRCINHEMETSENTHAAIPRIIINTNTTDKLMW